jgi:hypothetical protein
MTKRGTKMTARIPVTDEVQKAYKDLTHFTGLTYDELLRFFAQEMGAAINDTQRNLDWSREVGEKLSAFKEELAKGDK